ncbi:hypothetical protein HK098_002700 [Nowakowskiella sp. JEL0407]|nr:hypothetical protein HK098_002700 [Nowakowskiella sp. JEL0407]
MPKKSSSTLTLIFATVSANSKTCFGQTCVINVIKSSGFNIVVYADSGAISPTLSTSDLDPAQFGMIVNVPNSITKDTAIDVKVDTRFNEATLITNCNVIEENGNINKDCIVPDGSTTEIKIASFRSGSVKVGVDQTMIGKKFKVVLDVSSPGCRVDNDCFSNTVSSSVFSVLREKINDGAPPVENVQSPAPIVLSPSPVVVSPSPVSPSPSAVLPSNISSSSTTDVKTETKTTTITSVVSTTTTTPGQNEQQPSKIPDVPGRNDGKPGKKTFAAQPTSTTTTTTRTPIGGLVLGNSSGKLDISRIGLVVSIASSIVVYIF